MDKKEVQTKVGEIIKRRRTALDITQEELAAKTELHRTYIGSVERGERNISIVNLKKIASALKSNIFELFKNEL